MFFQPSEAKSKVAILSSPLFQKQKIHLGSFSPCTYYQSHYKTQTEHSLSIQSTCAWKVLIMSLSSFWSLPSQVGDRSFPLEAVKQLMLLMDLDDSVNPHLAETSVAAVCADPLLPQIFLPVCQEKGAGIAFSKLGKTEQRRQQ